MRFGRSLALSVALSSSAVAGVAAETSSVVYLDQGPAWTSKARSQFYSQDQGSKMIPLSWLLALKQPNGQPFLADSLARYGYLPNPANTNGLPVGFTTSGSGVQTVGMTCSACHTRQITVGGEAYRIDGGPAIVDFQSLLHDLDVAVGSVHSSPESFKDFAASVLGTRTPDEADLDGLRLDVDLWYLRYHSLMRTALPRQHPWGLSRLDAVSMIFNRLAGLDVGKPPSQLIADNIKIADAPVRYPFLWNAPFQDRTQWSGFADNGDSLLALSRNLGEVIGVFAAFQPNSVSIGNLTFTDYRNISANFDGLRANEDLVRQIGPPKWPWPVDNALAAKGKAIFDWPKEKGGCRECHGARPGQRLQTWATPVQNVGTDTHQFDVLTRAAATGALEGACVPVLTKPLKEIDTAFNMLATSVLGSILESLGGSLAVPVVCVNGTLPARNVLSAGSALLPITPPALPPELQDLQKAFRLPAPIAPNAVIEALSTSSGPVKGAYEARVLDGIWAAAPYLHNGSVPTLAELLKPAADRVRTFRVGEAYDIEAVGLAVDQGSASSQLETTDCSDLNSGDSRCGHEYGTTLDPQDKRALLEYLKVIGSAAP